MNLPVRGMPSATLPLQSTDLFYVVQGTSSGSNDKSVQYKDLTNDSAVTPGTYGNSTNVGQFTVDQKGRITAASNVAISGGGGGGSTIDLTQTLLKDDFQKGSTASGDVGELGWVNFSAMTFGYKLSEANHPGIATFTRTTTGLASAGINNGTNASVCLFADFFDIRFVVRNNSLANLGLRLGLWDSSQSAIANPPTTGIYFEYLNGSDTNWIGVCRSSSVQTRVNTGVAVSTNFITLRLRRINGTTIGFTAGGGTEQAVNTNVPSSGVAYLVIELNVINSQTLDIDAFAMQVSQLTR